MESVIQANAASLKAISLTHLRYEDGDLIGYVLAWASLLPVFISFGGFFTHFLFRRELHPMFFFLGLLVSQALNGVVKDMVQEARPDRCLALEACDSHGWPSSHSQYMCFFSAFLTLRTRAQTPPGPAKILALLLPWPFAFLVMYSRIYLGYHTVSQVLAGGAFGLFLGTVWYVIVELVFARVFPHIEDLPICKFFYIRDSSHIPNLMEYEYNKCREARKSPGSKNAPGPKDSSHILNVVEYEYHKCGAARKSSRSKNYCSPEVSND